MNLPDAVTNGFKKTNLLDLLFQWHKNKIREENSSRQTFRSLPVRNANFSRKSSVEFQEGIRYVF